MKSKIYPFVHCGVLAIVFRRVGGNSLSLIGYLWNHVSMIRGRSTKGKSFPFAYREVLAIVLRRIGDHSSSLIECLCSYVSLI